MPAMTVSTFGTVPPVTEMAPISAPPFGAATVTPGGAGGAPYAATMFPVSEGGVVGVALATAAGALLAGAGPGTGVDPVVAGGGEIAAGEGDAVGVSTFAELPAPPHATTPLAAENAMSAARPRRSIGTGRTPSGHAGAPSQKGHRVSDLRT
jgi:hypothetical protein